MYDLKHWQGQNLHHHKQLYQAAAATGYACVTLTQYGTPDSPVYAAVMIKRANNPEQRPFFAQSRQVFQATFDHQASQGWGPVIISATGPAGDQATRRSSPESSRRCQACDALPRVLPGSRCSLGRQRTMKF